MNDRLKFLGRQVIVTLDSIPGNPMITMGRLLAFGSDGSFEILKDDGFVHYCWPMLKIEEAK